MLILIGFIVYWFCHSVLKKKIFKFLFTLAVILGAGIYYFLNNGYIIKLIEEQIINNIIYINDLVSQAMPTNFISYKPLFILILPTIIFLIIFFTTKGLLNSILIFNFAIITTLWYLGYTEEIKKFLFYYILVTLITYCINSFKKNVRKLNKKGVKVNIKSQRIFLYTIVLCVIIAGITDFLPQDFKGKYSADIKGKFINKYVENGDADTGKAVKLKYDLTFSGYNKNANKLGGPVTVDKNLAFKVKSDAKYYLKGDVKDFYNGFTWSHSDVKYYLQSNKNISMFQNNFSRNFTSESNSLTIYPEGLNSSTLFTPEYSYNAVVDKGNIFYDDIPTFVTSSVVKKPYQISFYKLNNYGLSIHDYGISTDKIEVGTLYYNEWYKKYLELPDNLSSRIYDLVYSLTKDKKYNYEKIQAINKYLKLNYKYTLKVSNVPDGQEFLDYFLFTEKKGYCTYFATAETIMCRIAGIPARYVEGFKMADDKDSNGLYEVKNEDAHAWTEVLYMQTPTAGLWYTVDAVPNAVDYVHKEEEADKGSIFIQNGNTNNKPQTPSKGAKEVAGDIGASTSYKGISQNVLYIIYAVLLIILVNLLFIFLFKIKKHALLSMPSIIPLYKYSLERVEALGIKKPETVTDMEFINSLDSVLSLKLKEICKLAYGEYFGGIGVQEFNRKDFFKFIEGYLVKRQNKFIYFIKKYYYIGKISLIRNKIMILYKRINNISA
ncbi:transglutaminase-like domain-containing protein [Candidatus Clostridium stratigraminis]